MERLSREESKINSRKASGGHGVQKRRMEYICDDSFGPQWSLEIYNQDYDETKRFKYLRIVSCLLMGR